MEVFLKENDKRTEVNNINELVSNEVEEIRDESDDDAFIAVLKPNSADTENRNKNGVCNECDSNCDHNVKDHSDESNKTEKTEETEGGNVRVYQDTRVMQKMEEAEFFNNESKKYLMFDESYSTKSISEIYVETFDTFFLAFWNIQIITTPSSI